MKRIQWTILLALVALLWSTAALADTPPLPRLFPKRATVEVPSGPGLVQLRLPEEVQRNIKSNLSDIRLLDEDGQEVPFIHDSAAHSWTPKKWLTRKDGEVVQQAVVRRVARDRRRRGGRTVYHEEYLVHRPHRVTDMEAWKLRLGSSKSRYVARVVVVDGDDPKRELARGSLYRLQWPLREDGGIMLPRELPSRIRIIIDGEDGYLEPTAHYHGRRPYDLIPMPFVLAQQQQIQNKGVTVVTVERPPGVVPLALTLNTSTGTFHRRVVIRDSGPGGGAEVLGNGAVYRVADMDGVEAVRVLMSAPQSSRISIQITNGDSPPLKDIQVVALVEPTMLLFDSSQPLTLYYGGGRAHRPDYDVQSLVERRKLHERSRWRIAELGATEDNPAFDPSPALNFLLRPGAAVEASSFRHRRSLKVSGAREGLSKLRLSAADVAASRNVLHDIRIVDGDGKQWPFILDRDEVSITFEATVGAPVVRVDGTHYAITLPAQPLAVTSMDLSNGARMVNRSYKMYGFVGDRREQTAFGTLVRQPRTDTTLTIDIHGRAYDRLDLVIDDGGDAPLSIARATLTADSGDLYLAAPDGNYTMLLGNAAMGSPTYELRNARTLVLALPAAAIQAGELEANPDHQPKKEDPSPTILMWAAIALAVLLLGGLTYRAAREPDDDDAQANGDNTATDDETGNRAGEGEEVADVEDDSAEDDDDADAS